MVKEIFHRGKLLVIRKRTVLQTGKDVEKGSAVKALVAAVCITVT